MCVAVPNEGNKWNFDNSQSIYQYFLAIYEAFLEISQIYWPVAANIDIGWCQYQNFPKLLCIKKLENLIYDNFA